MAQFPIDIVADILSRLLVEPLLRFRCVSKPWCALIDSPHFVKLHLKQSMESKNNRQLILSDDIKMFSVSMMIDSSLDAAVKLDLPPLHKNCYPSVLASCNGLVLVILYPEKNLAIWNPFTKKFQILPINTSGVVRETSPMYDIDHCGIGYDSVHDDYKVVKIIQFLIGESHVQVYSLKMNSWRNVITDFPYYLSVDAPSRGMLVSGALHWVASETGDHCDDRLIFAFDLATEEYRIVPIPSLDHKELDGMFMEVASLEGFLCVLCKYLDDGPYNIWVLKDYGVKESWTKLISIPLQNSIEPFNYPVAFSTDGTKVLLLQEGRTLIWYDLKHKVVQTVNICGLHNVSDAQFCVQSLVPLGKDGIGNGMKRRKKESKDKMPKEIKKKRGGFLSEGSSPCSMEVEEE